MVVPICERRALVAHFPMKQMRQSRHDAATDWPAGYKSGRHLLWVKSGELYRRETYCARKHSAIVQSGRLESSQAWSDLLVCSQSPGESRAAASLDQSPSGHRLSASGHPARQTVRDASSETACRGGLRLRAVETHSAYLPRRPQTHRSIFASSFGRLGQLLLLGLAASGGRLVSGGCEDPHEHPTDHCRRQARVGIRVLGVGLQHRQRSSLSRCALMSACIMDMLSVAGCMQ